MSINTDNMITPAGWSILPRRVQAEIFNYLTLKEMQVMSLVSKYFYFTGKNGLDVCWEKVCCQRWPEKMKAKDITWKMHYETCSGNNMVRAIRNEKLELIAVIKSESDQRCYGKTLLQDSALYIQHGDDVEAHNLKNREEKPVLFENTTLLGNQLLKISDKESATLLDLKGEKVMEVRNTMRGEFEKFVICGDYLYLRSISSEKIFEIKIEQNCTVTLSEDDVEPSSLVKVVDYAGGSAVKGFGFNKFMHYDCESKTATITKFGDKAVIASFNFDTETPLFNQYKFEFTNSNTILGWNGYRDIMRIDLLTTSVSQWRVKCPKPSIRSHINFGDIAITGDKAGVINFFHPTSDKPMCYLIFDENNEREESITPVNELSMSGDMLVAGTSTEVKVWGINWNLQKWTLLGGKPENRIDKSRLANELVPQPTYPKPKKKCVLF